MQSAACVHRDIPDQEVYAKNPRNYAIYAEGNIDMILQLRAEIDEFLKIPPPTPDAPADGNGANAEQAGGDVPATDSFNY